ncbi:hypothetical protein Mapa_015684 [Marchantia paleacea]|nr:hypothetical protein Mapa_015684 [Marchantia paleacea]
MMAKCGPDLVYTMGLSHFQKKINFNTDENMHQGIRKIAMCLMVVHNNQANCTQMNFSDSKNFRSWSRTIFTGFESRYEDKWRLQRGGTSSTNVAVVVVCQLLTLFQMISKVQESATESVCGHQQAARSVRCTCKSTGHQRHT